LGKVRGNSLGNNRSNQRLKTLIMQGIQQITQEVNKKSKLNNQETTKKVLNAFLEVTKQKLIEGESLSFKGFFTIKRSTIQAKGSKHCSKHDKNFE